MKQTITQHTLRRLALASQGLHKNAPFGRGKTATLKALTALGYVQIDTISVVERAHHHILSTRVPNYAPEMLHRLQKDHLVFEYWHHAASFLPISDYRFYLPRMQQYRDKHKQEPASVRKLKKFIVDRISAEGALKARDFHLDDPASTRKRAGWWDWKPAKRALEQLFHEGHLIVTERDGFEKIYDLPERVLPDRANLSVPDLNEWADHCLEQTVNAHGSTTLTETAYLRRHGPLRKALQERINDQVSVQRLIPCQLESHGITYFVDPERLAQRLPAAGTQLKILSPFDNVLIKRARTETLFNFDFQIECYVPAPKRRFGYFCLPLLYRDQLIGRMDATADRRTRRLDIHALHFETGATLFTADEITEALDSALQTFSKRNQCDQWQISETFGTPAQRSSAKSLKRGVL